MAVSAAAVGSVDAVNVVDDDDQKTIFHGEAGEGNIELASWLSFM